MLMTELVFCTFSLLLLVSAICVVSSSNPVYSALSLIFCFLNAAALFLLIGAEYIAMTMIVVYVGAVMVLFLFVIMLLDIKNKKTKHGVKLYVPLILFLSCIILIELLWAFVESRNYFTKLPGVVEIDNITNAEAIGKQLYTRYFLPFQMAGLVLLVAIVGAITITVRHSKNAKKQSVYAQMLRNKENSVELVDAEISKGVSI